MADDIKATVRLTTYAMPTIAIATAAMHTGITHDVVIAALMLAKKHQWHS